MNAIERFTGELDTVLSDIAFSGLKHIHPEILERLKSLEGAARELGMGKGAELLAGFAGVLQAYKLGRGGAPPHGGSSDQAATLLCSLDFYNSNVKGNTGA
jgi:hypothetical protein